MDIAAESQSIFLQSAKVDTLWNGHDSGLRMDALVGACSRDTWTSGLGMDAPRIKCICSL